MNSRGSGYPGHLPRSDLYIIYSMSNSPYQQWQAELLDFSAREVGQPGVIVRLCSLDGDFPNLEVRPSSSGYTFVTPSYAELGEGSFPRLVLWLKRLFKQRIFGRYHFYCLNKSFAMKAFLESHPDLDSEAKLLWLDPDMVFNQPWEPPGEMVRRGHVAGQYWWGYDLEWCRKNSVSKDGSLCPASDKAIMFPFCISVGDMRRIVDTFSRFSKEIYRRTRDWKSEMYALVMAMGAAGLQCHTVAALGICNNWPEGLPNDSIAPISHYTQPMNDGNRREVWNKRKYTPDTLSEPWQRPPHPSSVTTLTDQRTLQVLHRLIDWQEEKMSKLPGKEWSKKKKKTGIIRPLIDAFLIRRSGLLHVAYYRSQFYQELKADRYLLRLSPFLHYVLFGAYENKNPNQFFDTEYYRDNNLDSIQPGQNPLVHYIRFGSRKRLNPSPSFDTGYYLDRNPGVDGSGLNPLLHYFQLGRQEGCSPNPLFSTICSVPKPLAADHTQGRDWLQQGLGASPVSNPPLAHRPDRMIRFEWDRGGWNNIRMQVEVLVCLAAKFDRALVLPAPDQWYLVPGDNSHLFDYFDEAAFRAAVPVLSSSTRAKDEWEVPAHLASINTVRLKKGEYHRQQDRESWYFGKTARMFGCFASVLGSDSGLCTLVHQAFRVRSDLLDQAGSCLRIMS